jgi:hypothetical protein
LQARENGCGCKFILGSFLSREVYNKNNMPQFVKMMEDIGYAVDVADAEKFESFISGFDPGKEEGESDAYVVALGLDRWRVEDDGIGPPLMKLLHDGPERGVHFIGCWIKASNFMAQTAGYSQTDDVNTKVFLRVDESSIQNLSRQMVKWAPQSNRALVSDTVELPEPKSIIPFSPLTEEEISAIADKYRKKA